MKENWEIHWKDYYEILQVHPAAEPEVIKAAYDKLTKKYHPDVNPDPTANKRVRDIIEAYEILGNPEKKRRYHEIYLYKTQNNDNTTPPFQSHNPKPEIYPQFITIRDLKAGETKKESFIIKNTGGQFSKVWLSNPNSWIKIVRQQSLLRTNKLPLLIEIEVRGDNWGFNYVGDIIIKLDIVETRIRVELVTQQKPVNQSREDVTPLKTTSDIFELKWCNKCNKNTNMRIGFIDKKPSIGTCPICHSVWDFRTKTQSYNDKITNDPEVDKRFKQFDLDMKLDRLYEQLTQYDEHPPKGERGKHAFFDRWQWEHKENEVRTWLDKFRGGAFQLGKCPFCKHESVILNRDATVGQCIDPNCTYIIAPEINE